MTSLAESIVQSNNDGWKSYLRFSLECFGNLFYFNLCKLHFAKLYDTDRSTILIGL